jgi:hypothetical protein
LLLAAGGPAVGATPGPAPADAQACVFIFYGAVGEGGAYLDRFRAAFERAGIRHLVIPNYGDPWTTDGLRRLIGEVGAVTDTNDLAYAKVLARSPGMKAAARQSRLLGEQYNLGGYSNGAVMAAGQAFAIAENGGVVDHLVLIGAPINADLYEAVRHHPNIRRVITIDLRQAGDPVRSGMSDAAIRLSIGRLALQFAPKTGHFSLSGADPAFDPPREALARALVREGLR